MVISHVGGLKMNEPREGRGIVKARDRVTHVTLTRLLLNPDHESLESRDAKPSFPSSNTLPRLLSVFMSS